jgi:hypothetical protein
LANHLQRLGYSWKRARYSPAQTLDPEIIAPHQASLETLDRVSQMGCQGFGWVVVGVGPVPS